MHPAESQMLLSWSALQLKEIGRLWEWEAGQDLSEHGEIKPRCETTWSCMSEDWSLLPWNLLTWLVPWELMDSCLRSGGPGSLLATPSCCP